MLHASWVYLQNLQDSKIVWMQVMTKEYYGLQTGMEKRVTELETSLTEKTTKLETYEKLEMELDDVVMQAAEGKNFF